MDKYEMLDSLIVQLDRLPDIKGIERCAVLVELVRRIEALKKGLHEEDTEHETRIEALKNQLSNLEKG